MKIFLILVAAAVVSACSLPGDVYRSSTNLSQYSNFELCRALLDADDRRRASSQSIRALDNEITKRGGDKDACFDGFLGKYGQTTICRDYQRAMARGEPTALVGFATNIRVQDIERGFERNDIRCDPRNYTGDTRSGLEVLGEKLDEYNEQTRERRNQNSSFECRQTAGGMRCYEY